LHIIRGVPKESQRVLLTVVADTCVRLLLIRATWHDHVANTLTLGPSSTLSKSARLVLNKQLDIGKGICKAPLTSL